MTTAIAKAARLAVPAAFLVVSGCAGLGSLGQVLGGMGGMGGGGGGGGSGQISGEVRYVDTRNQQLELQDSRTGQRQVTGFDSRTEVIYQQRSYQVANLEPGDLVRVQVQQDRQGRLYASRVYVEQSVQERGGVRAGAGGAVQPGRIQRFDGRVAWVDPDRGQFGLETGQSGTFAVALPYNPGGDTLDRFRRLRRGDQVRIEGELVNQGRIELLRFQ